MQVYHVSLDTEGDMYKLFEPRIPWAMSEEEDAYTPRICVSTNIVGAVSGVGYDAAFEAGTPIMVYSADVQERFLERPEELLAYHGVMDAMYTQEHWVTWPLMMHGNIYLRHGTEYVESISSEIINTTTKEAALSILVKYRKGLLDGSVTNLYKDTAD